MESFLNLCFAINVRNEYMKVKQKILDEINTPQVRTQIAVLVKTGENNVAIAMRRNADNGRMTKMDFLQAISQVSGIAVGEILEQDEQEQVPQS